MDETVLDLSSFIDSSNAMLSGVVPHLNSQNGLSPYIETGKNTTLKAANAVQTILNFSDDYSAQVNLIYIPSIYLFFRWMMSLPNPKKSYVSFMEFLLLSLLTAVFGGLSTSSVAVEFISL